MQHISVLGHLYNVMGEADSDNYSSVKLEGYHVNTTEAVPEWVDYLVKPSQPRRMFLNLTTFCYKFNSKSHYEASYISVFGEPEQESE
jgi:hypothetical protein